MCCSDHRAMTFAKSLLVRLLMAAGLSLAAVMTAQAQSPTAAHDLGVLGPVYPIAEPSLLAVIRQGLQQQLANGGLERLQRESQARVRQQIEHPVPVAGLQRTRTPRSFAFDPSIEVPYPVTDADGRVLVPPGTRINPLTRGLAVQAPVLLRRQRPAAGRSGPAPNTASARARSA